MIRTIQSTATLDLEATYSASDLDVVLRSLHSSDPISTADSLQRLVGGQRFREYLYGALYGDPGLEHVPAGVHWHLASLVDRKQMSVVFTSNYDDLLEDAKMSLGRSGRVVHFHGRLPRRSYPRPGMYDPPVITSRDYYAAEDKRRYERLAAALRAKTVLLVGFSLSDPNLTRVIRNEARDCRALLVASPRGLTVKQQRLRIDMLRRYWSGLNVAVTVVEAHEEVPAFLLSLRKAVARGAGRSPEAEAERALRASARHSLWTWAGQRQWRQRLVEAVSAAKDIAKSVKGDSSLTAGFYGIASDGYLTNHVTSRTRQVDGTRSRRRLLGESDEPWGAAGYAYAAGVAIASSSSGPAFDRNVPEKDLLAWQAERSAQSRLPAASVLCVPMWLKYKREATCVGVMYFSSRRPGAFDDTEDDDELESLLDQTFAAMIDGERGLLGRS